MSKTSFSSIHALGLFLSIFVIIVLITLVSVTLKYFKALAFNIKVIMKARCDSKSPFLALKDDIKKIVDTKIRWEVEKNIKENLPNQNSCIGRMKTAFGIYHPVLCLRLCWRGHIKVWKSNGLMVKRRMNYNFLEAPPVYNALLYLLTAVIS